MNVILFGSSGRIGQRLAAELLERGHSVTGVTRSDDGPISHERFTSTRGDAGDAGRVQELAAGHDVAVSTIGPPPDDPFAFDRTVEGLVDGLVGAGVTRLLMVGSAGTLAVEPGTDLIDSGRIPDDWIDLPKAHR